MPRDGDGDSAVVGLAGRFPGADNAPSLLALVVDGAHGFSKVPRRRATQVGRRGRLDSADRFDEIAFGVTANEARRIDRQQRVLLEVAYHALEDAAIAPSRTDQLISVYAAITPTDTGRFDADESAAYAYADHILRSNAFAATRVSYKLGLRGESILVDTACSSSLVAVHLACESLRSGQSDIALAAGVSIPLEQDEGYDAEEGMVSSPVGEARPFDEHASGAVPGSGCGVVVLMRLRDAVADRRRVRAVVIGSAVNNDGATKLGFMAPSALGQAEVIAAAQAMAEVEPASIHYLETHGTGTDLGDVVEFDALTRVFGARASAPWCSVGALKANIGHLDRAAGVAGLIKVVAMLEAAVVPPIAGFTVPNPKLGADMSPFSFPTVAQPWAEPGPRRAGVSAFGVGGTNCHVVVEEAPPGLHHSEGELPRARPRLFPLSAATSVALEATRAAFVGRLQEATEDEAAAIERTQVQGRTEHAFRSAVVAHSVREAAAALATAPVERARSRGVAFAFAGQGRPIVDGLRPLFDDERFGFRGALLDAATRVTEAGGPDVLWALYDACDRQEAHFSSFAVYQPTLFAVQWALAQEWRNRGVEPVAVLGHSVGEVTAACVAGVLSLDDAVQLVVERGKAMDRCPPGAMLSVGLDTDALEPLLAGTAVVIAAHNADELTVVSGPPAAVDAIATSLEADGVRTHRLSIRRASHSPMMQRAADDLLTVSHRLRFEEPRVAFVRNVTGSWSTPDDLASGYWSRHLVEPVEFRRSLRTLAEVDADVFLEIGPGNVLCRIAEQTDELRGWTVLASERGRDGEEEDASIGLSDVAAHLWTLGASVVLDGFAEPDGRFTAGSVYAFDHRRTWPKPTAATTPDAAATRVDDPARWLYEPCWTAAASLVDDTVPTTGERWIVTDEGAGIGAAVGDALRAAGAHVAVVDTVDVGAECVAAGPGASVVETLSFLDGSWSEAARAFGALVRSLPATTPTVWSIRPDASERMLGPGVMSVAAERVVPLEREALSWHSLAIGRADDAALIARAVRSATGTLRLAPDGLQSLTFAPAWPGWTSRPLRRGGRYVITGGLGLVGRALTTAIIRAVPCDVLLVGRRDASSDPRLAALQERAASTGSKVHYASADVTDVAAFVGSCRAFVAAAGGPINGFVHAAGYTDTSQFGFFDALDYDAAARVGDAKVVGVRAIEAAITDNADFVVLCSSVSTVLGAVRFGGYVAANAWLEHAASAHWERGDERWVAVAWDAWLPEGVVRGHPSDPVTDYALSAGEGGLVLKRALSSAAPVVVVSTTDINARRTRMRDVLDSGPEAFPAWSPDATTPEDPLGLVRAAVASVLGTADLDDDADLLSLGVDSLTMLKIVGRVRKAHGRSVSAAHALRHPTIAGIAAGIAESVTGEHPELHVVPVALDTEYPTTAVQRRWLELADEGYGSIDLAIRVDGSIDPHRLADALERVVERHSGLRTTFRRVPDGWRQHIVDARTVPVLDLVGRTTTVADVARAIFGTPLDLEHEAPFHVQVVRRDEQTTYVLVHAYHVLFDGWSSSVFLRDLDRAYRDTLDDERPPHYVDYASAFEKYVAAGGLSAGRADFVEMFDGLGSVSRVPAELAGRGDARGNLLRDRLDVDRYQAVRDAALACGQSPFTLLMAALVLLIHEVTADRDLVVGTTTAGRSSPETEDVVGVFVNPLPVRFAVVAEACVREFLGHVAARLAKALEHGTYPMEDLVASVEAFKGLGLNETFHCYLLFQSYWRPDQAIDGFPYRAEDLGIAHHKLMRDIEVVVEEVDGALEIELWYRDDRYRSSTAERWLARYLGLVEALAVDATRLNATVASLLASARPTL